MTTPAHQPLIHIGYHKTASTWFQKSLYPYVSNCCYLNRRLVRSVFLNTTAWSFDPADAREQLKTSQRPIICEEEFCGFPENGGLLESLSRDMARRLHSTYPGADIVIFIRNQLDMIRSTYLQYVRTGGTRSLRRFIEPYQYDSVYRNRWYKNPLLNLDHFTYRHLIGHYQQVFGADRVHIFCYEAFAADQKAFARRFADCFDLEVDVNGLNFGTRNESLGLITLQLSRLLGPFTRWDTLNRLKILPILPKWLPKAGLKALNKTPFSGPAVSNENLFGKRLMQSLWERFGKDNRILLDELGLDLPLQNYGYPLGNSNR